MLAIWFRAGNPWQDSDMDIAQHIAALEQEGVRLGAAASDLDADVPPCPQWTVRDVVVHTGGVHRWAASIVRDRLAEDPSPSDDELAKPGTRDPIEWFREGHIDLVATATATAGWSRSRRTASSRCPARTAPSALSAAPRPTSICGCGTDRRTSRSAASLRWPTSGRPCGCGGADATSALTLPAGVLDDVADPARSDRRDARRRSR
jgi:Mycothiol maleylpyruvate isomerase N-terminal domain